MITWSKDIDDANGISHFAAHFNGAVLRRVEFAGDDAGMRLIRVGDACNVEVSASVHGDAALPAVIAELHALRSRLMALTASQPEQPALPLT